MTTKPPPPQARTTRQVLLSTPVGNYMALVRALACSLLCAICLPGSVRAQDAHRIWGAVHTTAGDVYEGFIRWDRNEGSWVDILDGSKEIPEENYFAWLRSIGEDGPPVRTIDVNGYRISWEEDDPDFPFVATSGIRFGHLASLQVVDRDRVALVLRSGELMELEGGSTDMGPSMRELIVEVPGQREIEIDWDELDRVVFSAAPSGARASASRLYGTVEDREGNRFTGYVSWDLDEILASDVLDGETMDGGDELDIRFSEISSIARISGGARVVLTSDEELDLTGSNDVDRGNRGIQISDPRLGMVEVEWRDFHILRFHEPDRVAGYDTFDGGHRLQGTVVTQSGEQIEGVIRWDADEAESWEFLNGSTDEAAFTIEFSQVSRIERGEAFGAKVTLLDGRSFELDDSNDVDWDNKGILIAPIGSDGGNDLDGSRWRVIPWDDFREVTFTHDGGSPGS